MKLLIISHTPHYLKDAQIVGWGPTIREINSLTSLFDEIRHIGFLHSDPAPPSSLPYSSKKVSLIPVRPSGGSDLRRKLGILAMAPRYLSVINHHLRWADVVHVRCPANISLMAVLMLGLVRHPKFRWVKYACNWSPDQSEPWSFTLQRWLLNQGFHRGIVTVNGKWRDQPGHVYSFVNPCFHEDELESVGTQAEKKQLTPPFHFLFAGRLEEKKGVGRALNILAELHRRQVPVRFDVVGDGDRARFETKSEELGLRDIVHFHGWQPRSNLDVLYARAHFLLFPSSSSEGWPKVLSEAMAFGVVPIAGAISSIPQVLSFINTGVALPVSDLDSFVDVILGYIKHPEKWNLQSETAVKAAKMFTYSKYLNDLATVMDKHWGIHLQPHEKVLL